ncbi:Tat pathway signal protein [Lautropia dentalis]|uniref:Tat pathway signal protein n=1 Tax=Lautropia dentalis TaxID=2490857 RepID=UPI00131544D6|nr:Tat pathway signal protein [Lautropia dentalis]
MPNRREFLVTAAGVAAAGATASLSLSVQAREQDNPADNATAITEVYGDGMRLMGVSVEYRRPVNAAQIKAADYRVEGRTIREVYVSRTPAGTPYRSGRYVVIELNPDEAGALLVVKHPPAGKDASAAAGQNADEASGNAAVTGAGSASGAASGNAAGAGAGSASGAASGNAAGIGAGNASGTASGNTAAADAGKGPGNAGEKQEAAPTLKAARATVIVEPSNGQGSAQTLTTSRAVNRVFDDFQHFEYRDEATGKTVRYNLFAPRNRRAGQRYPLVLFMHDAGVTGSNVEATLYQGDGAIAWARPEAQSRNPCFVLAPQFDEIIADDDNRTSGYLDATINLVRQLTSDLPIDENRIYTTGQSGGGMMSIAMNIKYPDFFAASYLVACQWNADLITQNMAGVKWWITVSQDDAKAYPGQTAIVEKLAEYGARVARGEWNAQWTPAEFLAAFRRMDARGANINFVSFTKGSVFKTEAQANAGGASGHTATWQYAYDIAPVREWIFRQRRG